MAEPFEYVAKGEELCQKQQLKNAERAFQQAIRAYEKDKDNDGVAYALGRMGYCYEQSGEVDKAIRTYQRAVGLATDIPAIYHGLINLLVERDDLDAAFAAADQLQKYGQRHISGPSHQIFINLGAKSAREKQYDKAIELLSRTVETIKIQEFPNEHWAAKGNLGYAYEKAGSTNMAVEIYATAIKAGSNNRQTFTRYLIHLEKQKQYDQALQVIKHGLKVQHDAAWEADLRKRQQRIEGKAGKTPKQAPKKIIPAFSVRSGQKAISLLNQTKFSPQLTNLAVGSNTAYTTSGGKKPKLSAWNLADGTMEWQEELRKAVNGIVVTADSIVSYTSVGRIGEGETQLQFWSLSGKEIANQCLPDVFSEIETSKGEIFAGCRDGKIYAFSAYGEPLWSYRVPGSKEQQDSAYMRPCPYYICASPDLIVFSSFSDVFALNKNGRLRWQWSVPETKSSSQSSGITITMSSGAASIRGIDVASDTNDIVVTTDDVVYELNNGKVNNLIKRKGKIISRIALDSTGNVWAIAASEQVLVLQNQKATGRFPTPSNAFVSLNPNARKIIAWYGKDLSIATIAGKSIAQIEFVKNISHAHCMDDGRIVVGAGHLVILGITAQSPLVPHKSTKTNVATDVKELETTRSPARTVEEQGIPIRWIEGKKLDQRGGKAFYEGKNEQSVTIEQLALEYYGDLGYNGSWTENEYWWAIMSLLFWDIIFARLPGVYTPELGEFPSRMQDMPLDFFSDDFYPKRRKLIEKRIAELSQSQLFGFRKPNIEAELKRSFNRNKNKPCRPIDWTKVKTLTDLSIAAKVLTPEQLMKIMHRLLESFNEHRRGLPDLFLVNNGVPLFAEVKSEREKVAEHQFEWLLYLKNQVGVAVEICRVVAN